MKEAEGIKKSVDEIIGNDTVLKEKRKSKDDIQREKFEKIILTLETLNVRANILGNDLKIDFSQYDKLFYTAIDGLLEIMYGKEAGELIYFYLYERMNPDGSINQLEDEKGNLVTLMSPADLWYLIKHMNEKLEKENKRSLKKK